VEDGVLVGIVSDADLLNASPSPATSLSVWEMNYLLSKITVKDVMTKKVLTVTADTPIEEAARIMADHKIGGMPVVSEDGKTVVGIITETDLFKVLLELMGAREKGVRVTVIIEEKLGQLAAITKAITELGGNFIAFGQFAGSDSSNRMVTFKVSGLQEEELRQVIESVATTTIVDLRTI
jgi:acetoin utilization protein AcuB